MYVYRKHIYRCFMVTHDGHNIVILDRKDWIMKQIVTKFGSLKIDKGGDTVMSSDAIYYHTIYSKLMKLSSLYIVIRTHHSISIVINFETTKFCYNLAHDPIHSNINFNHIAYRVWLCYDHHTVIYQIDYFSICYNWVIPKCNYNFKQLLIPNDLGSSGNCGWYMSHFRNLT